MYHSINNENQGPHFSKYRNDIPSRLVRKVDLTREIPNLEIDEWTRRKSVRRSELAGFTLSRPFQLLLLIPGTRTGSVAIYGKQLAVSTTCRFWTRVRQLGEGEEEVAVCFRAAECAALIRPELWTWSTWSADAGLRLQWQLMRRVAHRPSGRLP